MVYDAGTSKTIKRFLNLEEHQGRGNFKKMNEQNLRTLRKLVTPYEKSDLQKSICQIINTLVPLILL